MKLIYKCFACFSFLTAHIAFAQDAHFSQFDANPFYINPALTGERLTDNKGIQINANYRDQMSQFTKSPGAFKNIAIGIDERINSKFSLGQFIYDNQGATGSLNTFGLMLCAAHHLIEQKEGGKTNQNLSVGLQLGIINQSIHPENFTYNEQYSVDSPDGFNTSIPSGETFERQSYTNFSANFGVYYRMTTKSKNQSLFGGFSVFNITQLNESFLGGFSTLPMRFNLHGGAVCKISDRLNLMPQFLYMNQASATNLCLNLLFFTKLEGSLYEPIYGIGIRNKDAVIFQGGLRFKGTSFRVSYDIVTNYTKSYKNTGIEFSLVQTFTKKGQTKQISNTEAISK